MEKLHTKTVSLPTNHATFAQGNKQALLQVFNMYSSFPLHEIPCTIQLDIHVSQLSISVGTFCCLLLYKIEIT